MEKKDVTVTKEEEKTISNSDEKDNNKSTQDKCDYCGVTEQRLYRFVY